MKYQTCKNYKRCHCLFCLYFVIKNTSKEKNHAEDQLFILLLFCNLKKTKKEKNHADEKFWNPQEVVLNGPK